MDRKEMSTTEYVSRRNVLKASGWVGGAFALGSSARRVGAQQLNGTIPSRWTVVAIPDTQKYAESSSLVSYAQDQTDWIAAQKNVMNVVFATHEGDIVENGDSVTEWERMSDVMNTLDGEVPYSALLGNHDFAVTGDRESSTENYRTYFGESRYEDYDWFGGTAPDDRGRYQRFDAGGYEFVHLSLEWAVPGSASDSDTTMGWAQDVLDANPTTPTIITTHTHLWDRPDREGHSPRSYGANSGQEIYSRISSRRTRRCSWFSTGIRSEPTASGHRSHRTTPTSTSTRCSRVTRTTRTAGTGGSGRSSSFRTVVWTKRIGSGSEPTRRRSTDSKPTIEAGSGSISISPIGSTTSRSRRQPILNGPKVHRTPTHNSNTR